ncbi:hypothetical protein [Actinotalea sp.]|uniref:hypothetical protein n=1 Tax=Actinotalea sp. TaxID=1872145 RepID=UPI0035649EEE
MRTFAVPIVAVAAMLGSGAWMVTQGLGGGGWTAGSMDGSAYGMMGGAGIGGVALSGDRTPVVDLVGARDRAQEFATDLRPGLVVGEVMQFERQYYAELIEADGSLATEVLIDPVSGDVQIELGPARMWNTSYGMMARGGSDARISATEAQRIADEWLAGQAGGDGLTAATADAFPGYYTLHTLREGKVDGMLSVNATTGDVWYHSWHGAFVRMSEEP